MTSPHAQEPVSDPHGCYRKSGQKRSPAGSEPSREDREALAFEGEAVILCRRCHWTITSRREAVEVDGRHAHTFFNPAGLLFEIGCFAHAPGCLNTGRPTIDFSWFPDFAWRYSFCSACHTHLGWQFLSRENTAFFGLILNRLVEGETSGGDG